MKFCNCINCKKAIKVNDNIELCSDCNKLLLSKIRDYLVENPGAQLETISKLTNIPPKIIRHYVSCGLIGEKMHNVKTCKTCGVMIDDDDIYCKKCSKRIKFMHELENYTDGNESNDLSRGEMHFLNSDKSSFIKRR